MGKEQGESNWSTLVLLYDKYCKWLLHKQIVHIVVMNV